TGVKLIQTGENLGYGGGNNVGIRYALEAGARYVWVLNNDTEVPPESLTRMIDVMQTAPGIGILGLDAYDPQTSSPIPLAPVPGLKASRLPIQHPERVLPAGVEEAEYVHGSCLLLRRETIEDLGGFDLRFFHFWEDIDLCWRARQAGWEVAYLASCRIIHRSGTSTAGASALRMYYTLRNLLLFGAIAQGVSVPRFMLSVAGIRIWTPCVLGIRGFLRPTFKLAIFRALIDAAWGRFGKSHVYSPN
ncbi:MAG: glycosyltransferase family 2 protein, partial [Chloroflexota bacterium]|nr:glycosyltransferase family 2 protein [Chloroflexota bacterium]